MKCQKCGRIIDNESMYCEYCGHKIIKNDDGLQQTEVRKNAFGLLAMNIFLVTLVFFTFLPMGLKVLNMSTSWVTPFVYIGYSLSIIFELIGMIICKKNKSIDMQTSGMNYGSASMVFSIFMLIAKIARMY